MELYDEIDKAAIERLRGTQSMPRFANGVLLVIAILMGGTGVAALGDGSGLIGIALAGGCVYGMIRVSRYSQAKEDALLRELALKRADTEARAHQRALELAKAAAGSGRGASSPPREIVSSDRLVERQVLVMRCPFCKKLTPADLKECENCGGRI
ncbi:MAG: hypothetical protein IPM79_12500 [Polyangiaceae bacterium]|nr:hypothetical protein [Polyangiaceae bacterium]MBK8938430.1 hypothetical protein [Polyangiaceae bacterium]